MGAILRKQEKWMRQIAREEIALAVASLRAAYPDPTNPTRAEAQLAEAQRTVAQFLSDSLSPTRPALGKAVSD